MNILLVEDEKRVSDFIARGLKADGFIVTVASDGETGLEYLKNQTFDALVLDIMLPGISGYDVCRKIRMKKNHIPILMLTAMGEMDDKIQGLDMGADDYMSKPFEFDELVARLHALNRRANDYRESNRENSNILISGNIRFDQGAYLVFVDDCEVQLTDKEREMLLMFLLNPGKVLTRERILNSIWGVDADPLTNVIDVYIGRLRNKMSLSKRQLATLRGIGYRYHPNSEE